MRTYKTTVEGVHYTINAETLKTAVAEALRLFRHDYPAWQPTEQQRNESWSDMYYRQYWW